MEKDIAIVDVMSDLDKALQPIISLYLKKGVRIKYNFDVEINCKKKHLTLEKNSYNGITRT